MTQLALFDYNSLDSETRIVVKQKAGEIKTLVKASAQNIVAIGEKLTETKAALGHGQFGCWLELEFGWSDRSARNYMSVFESFKSENFADLEIAASALYLLSSPSTPEEARVEALELAKSGEFITPTKAKAIVESHKSPVTVEIRGSADEDSLLEWYFPDDDEPVTVSFQTPDYTPKAEVKLDVNNFTAAKVDGGLTLIPKSALGETDGQSNASMPNRFTSMEKSSKSDVHPTPEKITQYLYKFFGEIDLDPCSDLGKNIKAKKHYTIEDNGLAQEWEGNLFINPPFSEVEQWAEKAIADYQAGKITELIFLSKFDARVGWFKPLINTAIMFCVVEGYVSFDGNNGYPATFSTVLWYFGDRDAHFLSVFSELGWVCQAFAKE